MDPSASTASVIRTSRQRDEQEWLVFRWFITFDEVIEEALGAAKCVVVLWSKSSASSDWVKGEAAEGLRRKILVPVRIDSANALQIAPLMGLDFIDLGGKLIEEFVRLSFQNS